MPTCHGHRKEMSEGGGTAVLMHAENEMPGNGIFQ